MTLTLWMPRGSVFPFSETWPSLFDDGHLGSFNPSPSSAGSTSRRRLKQRQARINRGRRTSTALIENGGFRANLDVQQFHPDEITVKVVDDFLVVEGKHEERSDEHGYISRSFKRRYEIPDNVDDKAFDSHLSPDGVLTVAAPLKKPIALPDENERIIPIVHTNAPAITTTAGREAEAIL